MDGGACTSGTRSWSDTPPWAPEAGRTWPQSLLLGAGGSLAVTGEIGLTLAHRLPGKPAEGQAPHRPSDKNNHQLSLGQACREVSHVIGVSVKQALVKQGMGREQEDRHLELPDPTPRFSPLYQGWRQPACHAITATAQASLILLISPFISTSLSDFSPSARRRLMTPFCLNT